MPITFAAAASHAPGIKEMNDASDRIIAGFYDMMGVGNMLRLRS